MASNRKKLSFLVSRFPLPLDKGDKLRAYEQLKILAQEFDIQFIYVSNRKINEEHRRNLEKWVKELVEIRISRLTSYIFTCLAFFTRVPFQVAYFYNPLQAKTVQQKIRTFRPDHIYCQLVRMAEYVKEIHEFPKTIDFMDAFAKGFEQRAAKSSWWQKWFYQTEAERLRNYERRIFDYFDHHTIISQEDQQAILHPHRQKIEVVRNGVRDTFFEAMNIPPTYSACFVGNLSYAPNVDALQFLTEDILPLVWRTKPHFTLAVFGANVHPKIKAMATDERIHIVGWIEDIRLGYKSAGMCVAPMRIGTGIQNKIIEAMALGIPCITTPLCNRSIKAPADAIGIGSNAQELANLMIEFGNPLQTTALSQKGKDFAVEQFSWVKNTSTLVKLFEKSN